MTDRAEARWAVVDAINAFAHALDTRDWALLGALLAPDVSYGARKVEAGIEGDYFAEIEGADAMVRFVGGTFSRLAATHHVFGNHRVTLAADGLSASASCHMRAHHAGKGDKAHLFQESLGRFDFEAALVDGRWRLTRIVQNIYTTQGTNDVFA